MNQSVVGLFDQPEVAKAAIADLISSGVPKESISFITAAPGEMEDGNLGVDGAATGAASGGIVGGLLGLLAGVGVVVLPIGFLVAGPLAGLIAGGVAGAAGGGLLGGLIGLGMPDEHADAYAETVKRGGSMVTVHTDTSQVPAIEAVLNRDGAIDVQARSDAMRAHGWKGFDHAESFAEDQWNVIRNAAEAPAEYEESTMEAERKKVASYMK